MPLCGGYTLEEISITQLQAAYHEGYLNTSQVVTCFIERIRQTNGWSNSIQETNPDAFLDATRLDQERANGNIRGPLHGIPYVVKDNIATYGEMETTAGSWMLMGSKVPRDAFVVSRLRAAGAILLGKATLTEWAHMRSSNLSEGYSARGGQGRSPYNFTVSPGGSSSGSAVSVAANQCVFSLGTETDGSVMIPAERNALVGIKPTVGLTSRNGVIPETRHMDTVGVFGRTVKDAALALDGIYGVDPRDSFTTRQQGKTPEQGFAQFVASKDALRGARFGIPWDSFWALNSPEQNIEIIKILGFLTSEGATVVNGTEIGGKETLINPTGWDWDWRGKLGFPNESAYTGKPKPVLLAFRLQKGVKSNVLGF
ncbi:putative amidase [Rosellinia necatrix]|uniref:Putative amidase n=1 Tax=Rosellinia necatrix TaxID=77044 RepID=A0A1W2TAL4_ROSNE|nr:putative amidase [Rosellinia necatrix]